MTISYEEIILNKSIILHLYNYAKEKVLKSFEINSSILWLKYTLAHRQLRFGNPLSPDQNSLAMGNGKWES
jgi:hypothetical protein